MIFYPFIEEHFYSIARSQMTVSKHIESVAVIGAGISGVVSAKQLKLAGIKVVVYERTGTVGGIWYIYRP